MLNLFQRASKCAHQKRRRAPDTCHGIHPDQTASSPCQQRTIPCTWNARLEGSVVSSVVSDDLDIVCCCRALRPSAGAICLLRSLQFHDVSRVAFVSSIAYVDHRVPAVAQTHYELLSPKTKDDVTHARRNTSNIEKTTSLAVCTACTGGCGGSVATPDAMVLSKTRLFFLTLCFLLKRFSGPTRTGRFPAIRVCFVHSW